MFKDMGPDFVCTINSLDERFEMTNPSSFWLFTNFGFEGQADDIEIPLGNGCDRPDGGILNARTLTVKARLDVIKEALDIEVGSLIRLPYAAAAFAPETDVFETVGIVFDVSINAELGEFALLVISAAGFKIVAVKVEPIAILPAFTLLLLISLSEVGKMPPWGDGCIGLFVERLPG